jgi:3,4-dihydroxy 2-butanone 4-phosphate synthase/GTP cyclohydrolase II
MSGMAIVEEAVATIARGGMAVVVDSEERENEGALVMAAEWATAASVNFMVTEARGIVCVPMLPERLEALGIPPMVDRGGDPHGTAFHVSVDHRDGSTGISAADRALAIRALADADTDPGDLVQPGHILPLAYRSGGVLERAGHTEASIDLTVLAGLSPASVICGIASDDGTMARLPELREFAARHGLPLLSIADLIEFRGGTEARVDRVGQGELWLDAGEFRMVACGDPQDGGEHLALLLGDLAIERIADAGAGVLVHLRGEGPGSERRSRHDTDRLPAESLSLADEPGEIAHLLAVG